MPSRAQQTISSHHKWVALGVCTYVAIVLLVDTLAVMDVREPVRWAMFSWRLGLLVPSLRTSALGSFDLYKFVFWFLLPFLVSLPRLDTRYLYKTTWKRSDLHIIGTLAALGVFAMLLIPHVPALRAFYPSLANWSAGARLHFFLNHLVWIASWLPGWEFMHRYLLLRHVQPVGPDWREPLSQPAQWGWLAVPIMETAYHLQKAGLETLGMELFSVILTLWCLKRRNWLLAFTAHLIIEVELVLFLVLSP